MIFLTSERLERHTPTKLSYSSKKTLILSKRLKEREQNQRRKLESEGSRDETTGFNVCSDFLVIYFEM